jgi:hypothetical protein
MCYRGKKELVHRLAAMLWKGFDLGSAKHVLHRCDKPACFNPRCLFEGTHLDNMVDAVNKGRHFSVRQLRKRRCKNGHLLSGKNLYLQPRGRACKECRRESVRRWRKRNRV